MKPDYAEALNALSTLYNNQKRFDEAAAMSAKAAAAGGGARQRRRDVQPGHHPLEPGQDRRGQGEVRRDAQGERRSTPTRTIQLGMALLNEGKLPEAVAAFETYVKLAPDGQYADAGEGDDRAAEEVTSTGAELTS